MGLRSIEIYDANNVQLLFEFVIMSNRGNHFTVDTGFKPRIMTSLEPRLCEPDSLRYDGSHIPTSNLVPQNTLGCAHHHTCMSITIALVLSLWGYEAKNI